MAVTKRRTNTRKSKASLSVEYHFSLGCLRQSQLLAYQRQRNFWNIFSVDDHMFLEFVVTDVPEIVLHFVDAIFWASSRKSKME